MLGGGGVLFGVIVCIQGFSLCNRSHVIVLSPWKAVVVSLAEEFGASVSVTLGDDLLKDEDNYPQVCAYLLNCT